MAKTTVEAVPPTAADQHVVSWTAPKDVGAGASDKNVVALAAIGGEQHRRPRPGRLDNVVAAAAAYDDAIICVDAGDRPPAAQPRRRADAVFFFILACIAPL